MAGPKFTRYYGPLAEAIGDLRSVVLLQIEFMLYVQGKEIDGNTWVRITERKLARTLGRSQAAVHRAINWLFLNNFLHARDDLNKKRFDRTKWYALNWFGIGELNGAWPGPTRDSTIPDYIYSKYNLNRTQPIASVNDPIHADEGAEPVRSIPVRKKAPENVGSTYSFPKTPVDSYSPSSQPSLLPAKPRKRKVGRPQTADPIQPMHTQFMYELCYGVMDATQALILNSKQRGRVADALATLREGKAKLDDIPKFEDWWKTQWMSRSSEGGYQRPRPDQIAEHWWAAMNHDKKPVRKKIDDPETDDDIETKIRTFRRQRRT